MNSPPPPPPKKKRKKKVKLKQVEGHAQIAVNGVGSLKTVVALGKTKRIQLRTITDISKLNQTLQ